LSLAVQLLPGTIYLGCLPDSSGSRGDVGI
jgi:hypothetical protein